MFRLCSEREFASASSALESGALQLCSPDSYRTPRVPILHPGGQTIVKGGSACKRSERVSCVVLLHISASHMQTKFSDNANSTIRFTLIYPEARSAALVTDCPNTLRLVIYIALGHRNLCSCACRHHNHTEGCTSDRLHVRKLKIIVYLVRVVIVQTGVSR